ncbi:MAG TPA: glycoside hydrolase family 95 protein, partial [Bacilli bacterium]
FESLLPDMRRNAQALYGCRGILTPLFASPDSGLKKNLQPHVVYWSAGAGWLAQHFYDYWLFTGDLEFLKKRTIPFLKECALFYEDFLMIGENGYFISSPSNSPENNPNGNFKEALHVSVCINATMDFAVAKEVLSNLCHSCRLLGIDEDDVIKWEAMLTRIPPYQINEDGAVREWMHPDLKDNYHHRHQSHLYPLFPGFEITKDSNPECFEACRVAVEKRLVIGLKEQTGWSLSHMANIYARLGDGNRALECLEISSRSCVGDNLFTYHNDWRNQGITSKMIWGRSAPFQIDANMGWTAAMLEMLVFSIPGLVKLLPALPPSWSHGRVRGILCRGGIEIALSWNMVARHMTIQLLSNKNQTIKLKFPYPIKAIGSVGELKDSVNGSIVRDINLIKDISIIMDITFEK